MLNAALSYGKGSAKTTRNLEFLVCDAPQPCRGWPNGLVELVRAFIK